MEELTIKTHDFDNARQQIKEYLDKAPANLEFSKFETSGGLLGLFDHKVTGDEANEFAAKVQEYFMKLNQADKDFYNEFEQVYNALESLDKDYIQQIIISIKSAEKASREAKDAQRDIDRTIETLMKTIDVLKGFKEEMKAYVHLEDIDDIWNDLRGLENEHGKLSEEVDVHIEETEKQISEIKMSQERDNRLLDQKVMISYAVAGSSLVLVVIQILLNVIGII